MYEPEIVGGADKNPRILDLRYYPLMTNPPEGWAYSSYVHCPLCHNPFVHFKAPIRVFHANKAAQVLVIPVDSKCGCKFDLRFGGHEEATFITHTIIDPCTADE